MVRTRKRRLAAASVVAGVLAAGLGTTVALWQAQDSTALALRGARHAFQARHVDGDPGRIRVTSPDVLSLTIESSTVVDQLKDGGHAYVPFRLYGAVEGGGAMAYEFAGLDAGVLATHARAALWRVDDAAKQCSGSTLEGERQYPIDAAHGPLKDMAANRGNATANEPLRDQLVAPSDDGTGVEEGRHDYCLELRLLGSYYQNTATATGATADGVGVTSSDSWDGTFVPQIPAGDETTIHLERWVSRASSPDASADVSQGSADRRS